MANIAQSLFGDWERIAVAVPEGFRPGGSEVRPLPTIKYPMKMKYFIFMGYLR